jgi:16S rRNA (adenine1518-N6/adenine1519-N6)-dimethyltransferase
VRELAARLDIRPTKKLGQNFVHDANTVRRIARLAGLTGDDVVLEIGPGLGSLTLALLADPPAARVLAVEIDPRLAAALPETVAARQPESVGRLTVLTLDAMDLRGEDLPAEPTSLVANLPYNVGVPVLLTALQRLPSVRKGLVMVQSEVVDRMAAPPGGRSYGAPSVKLAWFASARRAGPVPRAVFWPVPGVDSALVALDRRPAPDTPAGRDTPSPPDGAARTAVFQVIDAAFAQRRKTLRSALSGWAGSAAEAERICRAAGVDPAARGETLGIADYVALARHRDRQPEVAR